MSFFVILQIQIKGYDERWKNGVDGSSGEL